ncbi:MAG TPA: hypothetical protein DEQ65_01320, partial [Ruminococcaceae bacterium]|nr:hypothetical protein [Oscillospiraceae bacterium]
KVHLLNSCFSYKVKKSRYVRAQGADCRGGNGLPRSLCSLAMTRKAKAVKSIAMTGKRKFNRTP